jgi:hypothetical protein
MISKMLKSDMINWFYWFILICFIPVKDRWFIMQASYIISEKNYNIHTLHTGKNVSFWVNKASFWVIKTKKRIILTARGPGSKKKRIILTTGGLGVKINEQY